MTLLFYLLTISGSVLLYLSHTNQRWLKRPLSWPARLSGITLMFSGLIAAVLFLPLNSALFAWLVLVLLCGGCVPLLSLLSSSREEAS